MYTDDEKRKNNIPKAEKDENDFYNYEGYNEQVKNNESSKKSKKFIFVIILMIVLLVLILLLVKSCDKEEEPTIPIASIVLNVDSLELKVGNSQKIEYTVIDSDEPISVTWLSSDEKIATVTEDGTVTATLVGVTTITASYFINNVPYEKQCTVTVIENDKIDIVDNKKPTLKYTMSGGKNNEWTNETVTIKVEASDNSGKVNVKYALNCTSKCKYINISNNTIKISEEGTNIVTIIASDPNNNSVKEIINVKIDKTKPVCMINLKDELKGTLQVETTDNNGSGLSYYGFSSSYQGTNEQEKNVKEGKHSYYVKDKAGNTNTCTINIEAKTQYRYQDCTSCKRCQSAGCASYNNWTLSSESQVKSCTPSTTTNKKVECICQTQSIVNNKPALCTIYLQSIYTKTCKQYKSNCDTCGGCDIYGEFSEWSDNQYKESSSRKVETRTVYVKG